MLLIKLSSIRVLKPKILYEQQKQIFGKKMYLRALRHGTSNKKTYSFRIVTVSMYRASNILATSFATFYQLCNLYTNKFYLTKKKKKIQQNILFKNLIRHNNSPTKQFNEHQPQTAIPIPPQLHLSV